MSQDWILNVWGVRGSMPAISPDFAEYGGNTSCVSVDCGEDVVVFDAGSGLMPLSRRLDGKRPIHLFLSHVHVDHLLGLFTFPLLYNPEAELYFYGEARDGVPFRRQLETIIGPPYWPVSFPNFRARISIHEIGPDQEIALAGGRTVRTLRSSHPNLGLIYRLDAPEKRGIAYTLDCELTGELRPRLTEFCRGAGVVVWDGNFVQADLEAHRGWGHSSWEQGEALGREADVGTVLMAHYNQAYTDAFLREQEGRFQGTGVRFAREGMEIRL